MQLKIDKDFIHSIRLLPAVINYNNIFDKSESEIIVKNEFTHDYLLKHFQISKCIIDFYYKNTEHLITEKEYEKRVKDFNLITEKNRYLKPYSLIILGAYHRRQDLLFKLEDIVFLEMDTKINNSDIKTFYDLKPYFINYRDGFNIGYNKFENDIVKRYSTEFSDKQDLIYKTFEFLTTKKWLKSVGFTRTFNKNGLSDVIKGFEDGKEQGYYYKAWCIVFSHNRLFTPLFEDYYSKLESTDENHLDNKEIEKPKSFDYIKIGVLIAEGKLTKHKKGFEYIKKTFDKIELEKELKKDLKIKSIRQYIEGTFGVDTETTLNNDLCRHPIKIKNIANYCSFYKIPITKEYQSLFDALE